MKYLVQRVEGGVLLEMIIVDDFGKAVLKARDMAEKMQEQLGKSWKVRKMHNWEQKEPILSFEFEKGYSVDVMAEDENNDERFRKILDTLIDGEWEVWMW